MAEPRSPAVFVSACERSLIRSVNAGTRRASPQNPPHPWHDSRCTRLRVAANRCLWFANPLPSSIESLSLAIRHANHRNARLPQLQICGNREVHFPFDHGQFAAEISVGKLGATPLGLRRRTKMCAYRRSGHRLRRQADGVIIGEQGALICAYALIWESGKYSN